jgi:hypothetical protein
MTIHVEKRIEGDDALGGADMDPARIIALTADVRGTTDSKIAEIQAVTGRTKILALNAAELIDSNLYERTHDVRWWATDSAVVECLAHSSDGAIAHATQRLGVILSAYTVYLDLWICDAKGRVIASSDGQGMLREMVELSTEGKTAGHYGEPDGRVVGFHKTPGYETYDGLGWYDCVIQEP